MWTTSITPKYRFDKSLKGNAKQICLKDVGAERTTAVWVELVYLYAQ